MEINLNQFMQKLSGNKEVSLEPSEKETENSNAVVYKRLAPDASIFDIIASKVDSGESEKKFIGIKGDSEIPNSIFDADGDGKVSIEEILAYLSGKRAGDVDETDEPDDIEININQSGRKIASRINNLTEDEKAVWDKYENMLNGASSANADNTLEFFSELSDAELANFINAYSYVYGEDGGFPELFFKLVFGCEFDDVESATSKGIIYNLKVEGNYLDSEYKDQLYRLIDMLPADSKKDIIKSLDPQYSEHGIMNNVFDNIMETLLFGNKFEINHLEENFPSYMRNPISGHGIEL